MEVPDPALQSANNTESAEFRFHILSEIIKSKLPIKIPITSAARSPGLPAKKVFFNEQEGFKLLLVIY